jgi:uncharacterized protein YoxC
MEEKDDLFTEQIEMEGTVQTADEVKQEEEKKSEPRELAVDIHVKENGLIFDNLQEIKRQIIEEINSEMAKINPDSVDEAKKLIVKTNKIIDDIETKRKAVGKEYTKPYDTLCDFVKTIRADIATLIVPLRNSVDKAEEERLRIRRAVIDQAILDRLARDDAKACSPIILGCSWFKDKKWENSSVTVKKVVSEIDVNVTRVVSEIEQLDLMGDGPITIAVVDKYKQSGSLVESLRYRHDLEAADKARQERIKAAEEDRISEQMRKEQAEIERINALKIGSEDNDEREAIQAESGVSPEAIKNTNPIEEPKKEIEDKEVDTAFRVRAKMSKITALKQYMKDNGILYGPVKENR